MKIGRSGSRWVSRRILFLALAGLLPKHPGAAESLPLRADLERKLFPDSNPARLAPGGSSVLGRPIASQTFPSSHPEAAPHVLVIGGIHGDEPASVELIRLWIDVLHVHHSGRFDWLFVPMLNPDGVLATPPTRTNARGVDLNRNFPTAGWESVSHRHWVRAGGSARRNPGLAPLSEPESAWLADQIERYKPDAIVSVHAPMRLLDFDGPHSPPRRLGSLSLRLLGTYPGSLGRYAGVEKRIPVLTVELANAKSMPSRIESTAMWKDLVSWLSRQFRTTLDRSRTAGLDVSAPSRQRSASARPPSRDRAALPSPAALLSSGEADGNSPRRDPDPSDRSRGGGPKPRIR